MGNVADDFYQRIGQPARSTVAIVPGGSDLAQSTRAIFVDADAAVTLVMVDDAPGDTRIFNLKGGTVYPFALRRVTAVSAGTVFALY